MQDTPSTGAVLEFLAVALEAHCEGLSAKERARFLRRMEIGFERREAAGALGHIAGPRTPAAVRADREAAHEVFRAALPRLLAP